VTYSTTYYEPFHVDRLFATMDLILKGRAAWNIVTSLNRGESANCGRDEHMGHDARYGRANEFMEVVLGQGFRDRVTQHSGRKSLTVRDFEP
jgi:alkanesulfonate monooxygenase SsuD/methylene tetrahydromethanopterin reductase-like flavin-dependent oxidoreductase (luciferase family)